MNYAKQHSKNSAFTLIEVVIAIGIFAIAFPAILGTFSLFSQLSNDIFVMNDCAELVDVGNLFLNGNKLDDETGEQLTFDKVYGWIFAARQNKTNATTIYAYAKDVNNTVWYMSQTIPEEYYGNIMPIKIQAPIVSLLSNTDFVEDPIKCKKTGIPLSLNFWTPNPVGTITKGSRIIKSYPMVLSR